LPLKCGDTFLLPKSSSDTEHLWIVITEPDANGQSVCVNITTRQSYSETTVILKAGDHPFVTHESVIFYTDARIVDLLKVGCAEFTHQEFRLHPS
jgi:CTP:molybdopterin cytidylyltransferase MocA